MSEHTTTRHRDELCDIVDVASRIERLLAQYPHLYGCIDPEELQRLSGALDSILDTIERKAPRLARRVGL